MINKEFIESCEQRIRSGEIAAVAADLTMISPKKVNRGFRYPLANIARRVGKLWFAMQVLAPIIRPQTKSDSLAPSDDEKIEYAILLSRLGSFLEAETVMDSVSDKSSIGYLQNSAYMRIFQWDYEHAIKPFQESLSLESKSYQSHVLRLNLISSLIFLERYDECEPYLSEVTSFAEKNLHRRIQGNCHELRAQLAFYRGNLLKCESEISMAESILKAGQTFDELMIHKWRAISTAFRSANSTSLKDLAAHASRRKHWETVRECDYFALQIDFDLQKFKHLYFGTPYPSYRKRLAKRFQMEPQDEFFERGHEGGSRLHLDTGKFASSSDRDAKAFAGLDLQLLNCLSKDFYRPMPLGSVFADLYPGEYFNPFTSPKRIGAVVTRVRRRLAKDGLDFNVVFEKGKLALVVGGRDQLLVPLRASAQNRASESDFSRFAIAWRELRTKVNSGHSLSAPELQELLSLSRTSVLRFTAWCLSKGLLERKGTGKATRYIVAIPK